MSDRDATVEGILAGLRRIVLSRVEASGLNDDSNPVAVQAQLDLIAAEVNHEIEAVTEFPGFKLTYKGQGDIVLGFRDDDD